jgi:hypothetical protein
MGFHHALHSEDWPVMPTVWNEFELKPVNFFDHNPALDFWAPLWVNERNRDLSTIDRIPH